jgi:hypothetical protein
MSEFENLGVEEQEVAEPADTSVESQEVAEPDGENEKQSADEAFAAMRRARQEAETRAEDAEREIEAMKAQANARAEAMKRIGGNENAEINALAESMGLDPDDIKSILDAEEESVKKDIEIERLRAEVDSINAERAMQEDLLKIQKLNPEIKSLSDLGDSFVNYIKAGLSAEEAYFATEKMKVAAEIKPPAEIGKLNTEPPQKDSFTREEVEAMSEEEIRKNYDKIIKASMKWKG